MLPKSSYDEVNCPLLFTAPLLSPKNISTDNNDNVLINKMSIDKSALLITYLFILNRLLIVFGYRMDKGWSRKNFDNFFSIQFFRHFRIGLVTIQVIKLDVWIKPEGQSAIV